MATDASAVGGAGDLGKGLFGYRKADVRQLITDRDTMLAEAEKRIRSSQTRIVQLESALAEANETGVRMQEQLGRLRQQVEALTARSAQVERFATRVKAEAQRLTEWKRQAQQASGAMRPTVDRFRVMLEELPARVESALSPVAGRIPSLSVEMADFVRAATPPAPPTA